MVGSGPGVSHPPQQEVVRAVVSPNSFAAVGQPKVLVTVSAGYHQVVGLWREVGRGPAAARVPPVEVPVSGAPTLRLVTFGKK